MGRHLHRILLLYVRRVSIPRTIPVVLMLLVVSVLDCADGNSIERRPLHPSDEGQEVIEQSDKAVSLENEEADNLKKTILRGLGLTRMPDVAKMNVSQEEYSRMYNVYLRSVEENARRHENRREATKVNRFFSFTHAHTQQRTTHGGRSRRAAAHRTWLYFPVDIPETRQQHVEIEHATLRLFMLAGSTASTVHLRVYQVLQPSPQYPYQEERLLVDQTVVTLNPSASRWTDLDVTRAAQAWNLGGNETNLGLEVECRDCVNQGIVFVTQETSGSNSSVSPVLNLLAGIHLDTREKRSTNGNDPLNVQERQKGVCHKDGQKCCRHVMKVNFKEIEGFEFILQPKEFDAGYCKGRCPPRYNPAHHHALLQSLVRKQQSHADNRIPRVCCAPSRLKDLEVLHLDMEDPTKLKMTLWDNMQVLECACS